MGQDPVLAPPQASSGEQWHQSHHDLNHVGSISMRTVPYK